MEPDIKLTVPDTPGVEIKLDPYSKAVSAHKAIAKELATLIKGGMNPRAAAEKFRVTLHGPGSNQKVRAALEELLQYELPAETRRRMVRARMNQVILSGQDKDAVAAAKVVASDPEVDIAVKQPGTSIDITFSQQTLEMFRKVSEEAEKS